MNISKRKKKEKRFLRRRVSRRRQRESVRIERWNWKMELEMSLRNGRTRPLRTHREVVVESTRSIASITSSHCFPSLFRSSFSYVGRILTSLEERERESCSKPEHERSTRIKKPQTALALFTKKREGGRKGRRERENWIHLAWTFGRLPACVRVSVVDPR